MMKFKIFNKILVVILSCVMLVVLVACGNSGDDDSSNINSDSNSTDTDETSTGNDFSEVSGEYTFDDMTLVLNDNGTFTLGDASGGYTYVVNEGFMGASTIVTVDDNGVDALADTLPWYWDGTFSLDMEGTEYTNTFSVTLDYYMPMINLSVEDGDGGYTITTEADESSPTGNMSTITVPNDDYDTVYAMGRWLGTKMELTDPGDPTSYTTDGYEPEEWENGMYYLEDQSLREMTYNEEDDTWNLSLPLASSYMGIQCYYNVDVSALLRDFDHFEDYNKNYIPYEAEKQSESYDWSVMFPRGSEEGTLDTSVVVTAEDGTEVQVCIYTPYGYDSDDVEEKYPVLYLIPGGGGDGAYMNWIKGGVVHNAFDNMIAESKVSPTILVSYTWADAIVYFDDVMNYVEENYNTYTDQAHRAIAGFSMGAVGSSVLVMDNPTLFKYCGFFSGADMLFKNDVGDFTEVDSRVDGMSEEYWDSIVENLREMDILIGGGVTDFNMFEGDSNSASISQLSEWLDYYDIEYYLELRAGGHDQASWTPLTEMFACDYLGNWGD